MTGRKQDRAASPEIRPTRPYALLSGGGSGGHVFPGLAIAEELEQRGWQVGWAGSSQGLESRLVRSRRIPFHALPAKPVVGQGLAGKARAAAVLARSSWRARSLVRRLDARIVVGTGGYVSAPAVIGARLAARPAFLVEPNAEAGLANRLLSRLAAEAAVAFDEAGRRLCCPAHTTGIPVRSEFFRQAAELPPDPPLRLLVLGGSQGARQINQLLPPALGLLFRLRAHGATLAGKLGSLAVCHQTGAVHLETTREAYRAAGFDDAELPRKETNGGGDQGTAPETTSGVPPGGHMAGPPGVRLEVVRFLDRMAEAMARSHLVVSRAGAITLAETCAAGRPSLLVPLALAGGHQASNARRLVEAGAAAVLPPEATAEDLAELLGDLMTNFERLRDMARSARSLGHRGAAAAIADRVELLAGGPSGTVDGQTDRSTGEAG